ncbi:hypothetical protein EZV62_028213 [Acer yangbiense]|uniref:Reverse transcriptase zinc-binding domain-containing protein n=1 Tax=Acer yangbiense TaxID=1000413 RepID=A0A5C7GP39_9ROSI|nr:hypothetical protein EZV62_028213 [Acer yangbiense]
MEPDEITRLCESFARISKEEKLWSVKENLKEALRLRVAIDVSKPLKRFLRMDLIGDGKESLLLLSGGKYEGLGLSAGSIVIKGGDKVDEIGEKRDTEREKVNIPLRFEKKAILEVESKAEAGRVGGVGYNVGMNEGVIKGEKKGKWKRLAREKRNRNASLDVETQEPKKRGVEISSLEGQKLCKKQNLGSGYGSNTDLVRNVFLPNEAKAILSLPPCGYPVNDRLLWHFHNSGNYTVWSGYWATRVSVSKPGGSGLGSAESWWQFFWRLRLPLKIKNFIWKACNDWIPTGVNLARHGVKLDTLCPVCLNKNETTVHALWRCRSLRGIRNGSVIGDGGNGRLLDGGSFLDFVSTANQRFLVWILSFFVWCGGVFGLDEIILFIPMSLPTSLRDYQGHVLASLCQNIKICYQPQIIEAMAILKGIWLAANAGLLPASLDSDALSVVNLVNSKVVPLADIGVVISFVHRLANKVAHALAKLALTHEVKWASLLSGVVVSGLWCLNFDFNVNGTQMVNLKRLLKTSEAEWNNGTITRHNHIEILQVIDDVLTGIDDWGGFQMPHMQLKMAVEVFSNSIVSV